MMKEGLDRESKYMPAVIRTLSTKYDYVIEHPVNREAVENGDKSTVVYNYIVGDLTLINKNGENWNVEVKGGGYVPKNQGLEENGKRKVDYYCFVVKKDTYLWFYSHSKITNYFKKINKICPKRFYYKDQIMPHSKAPGLRIYLINEIGAPDFEYKII